ncbi:MAG: YqjK-like family protein [Candidatus Obscuribacterales bacterium]|nr:YqjK-like family protein [Steroidobacteraceae bacterium]
MIRRFAQRRGEMIAQAAKQRIALAQQLQEWQRPVAWVERAWTVVRYLKSRPLLVALPVSLFALRRPRQLLRWFNRGWLIKAILRKLFVH